MKIKFILPALTEAKSNFWRPIKYSLFPPLGLATLAAYCSPDDDIDLQDEHVESLRTDDCPDLVIIQVYITNIESAIEFFNFCLPGCMAALFSIVLKGKTFFKQSPN